MQKWLSESKPGRMRCEDCRRPACTQCGTRPGTFLTSKQSLKTKQEKTSYLCPNCTCSPCQKCGCPPSKKQRTLHKGGSWTCGKCKHESLHPKTREHGAARPEVLKMKVDHCYRKILLSGRSAAKDASQYLTEWPIESPVFGRIFFCWRSSLKGHKAAREFSLRAHSFQFSFHSRCWKSEQRTMKACPRFCK